jgi:hypothetical protein
VPPRKIFTRLFAAKPERRSRKKELPPMARIPEGELERLKNEVSVQRLIEASGLELKKGGKDWLGRCPFHEDDTASLVVTPAKNLWHCFGCSIGGGPIDWCGFRRT